MRGTKAILVAALLCATAAPALADTIVDSDRVSGGGGGNLPPYLQCVPYARTVSGINIRGDAWTWWDQADGRYARGQQPRVGAVMAFKPFGKMELGHVAAVSRIIDSRTVLLRHANWSPINGRRGQIEDNVAAVDVSPDNDWSEVRVWFDPIQNLGSTHWPVSGFIYADAPKKGATKARLTLAGMTGPAMTGATTTGTGAKPAKLATTARADTGADGEDPITRIIAARLAGAD